MQKHVQKVKSLREVERAVQRARKEGKRIIATNGCFDLLHVGHVRNLAAAKALGGVLIVGINSDSSVRKNKGPSRPIIPAKERAEILASLASVDYVFVFPTKTPIPWIRKIKPDMHVKGGAEDVRRHPDFAAQKAEIEECGGKFLLVPHHKGKSTSAIIRKIKKET